MSDLILSVENGVATLTMNRPDARNALSEAMRTDLAKALHDVEQDPAVRCVRSHRRGRAFHGRRRRQEHGGKPQGQDS